MKPWGKKILPDNFRGEKEPQNPMCLLAYRKTTNGFCAMQNLRIFALVWKAEQENILKRMIYRADRGEFMI